MQISFQLTLGEYDSSALVVNEIEIVLQINGKIRDKMVISPDLTPDEMKELALRSEKVQSLIEGKQIVKLLPFLKAYKYCCKIIHCAL